MEETLSTKLKKTADEVLTRVGEAAQQASERIGEMREVQRISMQIRALTQERDRCRMTIADLVVRMFDQNAFLDALLKPEYQRIKEIDVEIAKLEKERAEVGAQEQAAAQAPAEPAPSDTPLDEFPCE